MFLLPYIGLIGAAIASMVAALIRFALSSWRGQVYYKSISSAQKTLTGLILIVAMAISNVMFTDKIFLEVLVIITIYMIAVMTYRADVVQVYVFLRQRYIAAGRGR